MLNDIKFSKTIPLLNAQKMSAEKILIYKSNMVA